MTRGTQKVLLPLFKNVLYNIQQSYLEQMKSLWKLGWANSNAQELNPSEHIGMHSHPALRHVLQSRPGSSPFIPHLGRNLKIYATMRCYIIQLYLRRVSQEKVIAGKKQLERNRTAFVLSCPVHFIFQTEIYLFLRYVPACSLGLLWYDWYNPMQQFIWNTYENQLICIYFFILKNQGRKYEKNNMLGAETGRNIWGSHVILSIKSEKQVNVNWAM